MTMSPPSTPCSPSSPSSVKTDVESPPPARKSRIKFDFSIETLMEYSVYRQDDAARRLKVAPITLKRNCQRRKYRWPYRTIKAKLRREARAAEKQRNAEAFATRMTTPPSPPLSMAELLLSLGHDKKIRFNSSPTSVSDLPSSTPMVYSPRTQFPLTNEPMGSTSPTQLPPLTLLLQKNRMQSPPVTRPHLTDVQALPHHPISHKSLFYSASFHSTAPKFPMRSMASLLEHCEHQRRL